MNDRISDLERRVKALENRPVAAPPPAMDPRPSSQKPSDFLWQLIGARLEQHGRRLDIDHAISLVRSQLHDEAIIRLFARPSSAR